MDVRNTIAFSILDHWGYHNVTVGDIDGRNFQAGYDQPKLRRGYTPRDRTYKTEMAVRHAYRLADISINCIEE